MATLFDEGFGNAEIEHLDVLEAIRHEIVIHDGAKAAGERVLFDRYDMVMREE